MGQALRGTDPQAGAIWLALFATAGALATCINLGTLHDGQTADSLLLSLISTQRWTSFYWFQDRYGMLVPLLAMPVHSPLANLLFQGSLMTTAALLAPFTVARFLCASTRAWVAAGALANVLLLFFTSHHLQFDWFVAQPYALAIGLGFAGLIAIEAARGLAARAAAVLLLVLAHWVNLSVLITLAPALLLRRGSVGAWTALGLGTAAGITAARLVDAPPTTTALIPIDEWPQAWLTLLRSTWVWLAHAPLLWLVLAGTLLTAIGLQRSGGGRQLRVAAVALGAALMHWVAVGSFEWVRLNQYVPRYSLPSLLMLAVAAAIVFAAPMRRRYGSICAGAWLGVYALALLSYGKPSLGGVKVRLDLRVGGMTAEVIRSGARVFAGEYWIVWPAIFHANYTLYGSGAPQVFGLTHRSAVTNDLWLDRGPILVATAPGDGAAAKHAAAVGIQLELVEHRPSIDLFKATPHPPAASVY